MHCAQILVRVFDFILSFVLSHLFISSHRPHFSLFFLPSLFFCSRSLFNHMSLIYNLFFNFFPGIMVNGKLLSLGTPQQLKSMHGTGYRVIVRLDESAITTEGDEDPLLVALNEKYNNEVEYVSTSSTKTMRVFSLSTADLSLGGLFELLEEKKEIIGIKDYSVSQTTMEQVFTKFAQFQKEEAVAH